MKRNTLIGGQILYWLNWHVIYYFLTLAGVVICLATWLYLGETIEHKTARFSLKHSASAYLSLLKHLRFMGYFLPVCFTLGGLVTFYAIAPYIFVNHLHIAANHYGYILLIVGLSYVLGAILARIGSIKLSANQLLCIGFILALAASLGLLLLNQLYTLKVLTVLLPMICYAISCGFISPISNTCALAAINTNKGSAAALLGSGSMLVSSLLTAILAHFSMNSLYPLGIVLTLTIVLSIVVCFSANKLS
ncbi:MAG: multidrug effflux MFS transporter [Gammaproteobacteria bacterium]|nr:multidrug effflux MFS transporter [Gammaproteobacteria bacterium]